MSDNQDESIKDDKEDPEIARLMRKKLTDMLEQKQRSVIPIGVIELDRTNFDQTISADNPTLVDFWAEWRGP